MGACRSYAAAITWGPATNIINSNNSPPDTDVSTAGSLVAAYSIGGATVPPTSVNGVVFNPFSVSTASSTTVGNFTLSFAGGPFFSPVTGGFGTPGATPFASLSSNYQALLSSGVYNPDGEITLTIASLTPGQTYQFEWWSNDSALLNAWYTTNAFAFGTSSTVGLLDNTTNSHGGLGRFAIGTFVANSSTESIVFSGAVDTPTINAFELRAIPVPVPAAVWAGIGLLAAMGGLGLIRQHVKFQYIRH
jgi:hypothetical protein